MVPSPSTPALPGVKHKSPDHDGDNSSRPPAKRSRKAINCEPCRASKLKCDKARPCSSCVLRGTASQCYIDGKGSDDHRRNGIDPHNEIARMRQSLATLEAYIIRGSNAPIRPAVASTYSSASIEHIAKQELDAESLSDNALPGMLAEKGKGGFYAGPTSMATLLLSLKAATDAREGDENIVSDRSGSEDVDAPLDISQGFDDDLLAQLPAIHIIDRLVDFYFEYCNWMYRHVNQVAFTAAWKRFKESASADRLVLATLSVIMAIAVRYLPSTHSLLSSFSGTREELGERFYDVAKEAHSRYRSESRALSLELVELGLVRTHYLTLSKNESEEIWSIRGELVSIGTAMGLHRDPDKWHMPRDVAERRRWAWWHIILLERWQCFLFGRPLSVSSRHFDTRQPSYVDPDVDKSGRLFLPNFALFKLADILGDIVDDAVSIRPVPYERVLEHDRDLVLWLEDLPRELDLDEYRLARALASPIPTDMRLGVQSVLIRTSYYHIRFTLHRPYAAAAHDHASPPDAPASASEKEGAEVGRPGLHERMAQSLDTAASAADKLIQLVGQARPDLIGNSSLAVAGHVHWGPFHCFSAAMFFSFQLIANPEQPGANLFRANIRRVLEILALSRGVPIADKASDILTALSPLYDTSVDTKNGPEGEKAKENVLSLVKGLAFPYHDSFATSRSHHDSPLSSSSAHAPLRRNSASSPSSLSSASGMHSSPSQMLPPSIQRVLHDGVTPAPPYSSALPSQLSRNGSMDLITPQSSLSTNSMDSNPYFSHTQPQPQSAHPPQYHPNLLPTSTHAYPPNSDDISMWGASVGFAQGEWARFLDVMQRPDAAALVGTQ